MSASETLRNFEFGRSIVPGTISRATWRISILRRESSNYFCIVLDGGRAEAVVFLDHETGETHPLAKSFTGFLGSLRQRARTDYAFGSDPREPDSSYEKIGTLVTTGACVQCGGSGKC